MEPLIARLRGQVRDDLYNAYAVALREAGDGREAERTQRMVDLKGYVRPGVHAQTRDFMRARVLTARGFVQDARAIYQRWITHWENWGASIKEDPKEKEWDRILMGPLAEYADLLVSIGLAEEAAPVRECRDAIVKKYRVPFP